MIDNLRKCKFKYSFRSYQQRVLNEAKLHLSDKKLNIVAAPGAGKTILALSLMVEIGEPTLIVAPTILLRQQWLDRLKNDFDGFEGIKQLISEDIYTPNLITITTYQSLYSVYKGKSQKSKDVDIVKVLKELNIKTIILDEAHHLKLAWLDAAKNVIDKLEDITTISLTATPPYDSEKTMWNKYINLCGDVDIEVAVPELVGTKDLAPHQDYIYLNYPSHIQNLEIENYSKKAIDFFVKYSNSSELVMAISMHEGIINLDSKLDYFIDNFEYYDSMISFLRFNNVDIKISSYFNYGYKEPYFDIRKMQILLTYCLYNDKKSYANFSKLFRQITRELNEIGAIYERKVNLTYTNDVRKAITQNAGKMESVKNILEFESKSLKDKLKAVVITENIYKELLMEADDYETKFIGVIPLFRYLSQKTSLKYIVLTGEIILIPVEYKEKLISISNEFDVAEQGVSIEEISFDFNYCKVNFFGNSEKNRVLVITKFFEDTDIEVLIGSNALIGEGWDAPFINTLIMATPVSAYVSANQIRGRVIRKNKKEPLKFANIWHLVCVEKELDNYVLGYDYENLVKRFEAFEGINKAGNNISYGIERLEIKKERKLSINNINELNIEFFNYANNRNVTYNKWFETLKNYKSIRKNRISEFECVSNVLNTNSENEAFLQLKNSVLVNRKKKDFGWADSLIIFLSMFLIVMWVIICQENGITSNIKNIIGFILGVTPFAIYRTGFFPKLIFKIREHLLKENIYNKILKSFIEATYKTLRQLNEISKESKLVINEVEDKIEYYLDNSSFHENDILKKSIKELTSKIDDARYAIKIGEFYFAVPSVIGKRAEQVALFKNNLTNKAEIIYLKSPEGKKALFNIKLLQNNLISTFNEVEENEKDKKNTIADDMVNMEVMKNYLNKE